MTTQTVGLATQTANYVFAGPTTGAAAVPSFRALVAADIPSLSSIYQPLDSDNTALAALATSGGAAYRTAANTWALRSIAAGTGIAVTNGNGNSGASHTIDWTAGNVQSITTTASCTLTFTAPTGPCHLTLKITHEASATAYTYTWPAAVKWPSGTAISCTNSSGAVDMVSIYYDGTNYYATGLNNFF
jgi:hypothetical protein